MRDVLHLDQLQSSLAWMKILRSKRCQSSQSNLSSLLSQLHPSNKTLTIMTASAYTITSSAKEWATSTNSMLSTLATGIQDDQTHDKPNPSELGTPADASRQKSWRERDSREDRGHLDDHSSRPTQAPTRCRLFNTRTSAPHMTCTSHKQDMDGTYETNKKE